MPAANSMAMKRETLNLRIKPAERDLIDRAAKARGKNRTDFVLEAARAAAEEALIEQRIIMADPEAYQNFWLVWIKHLHLMPHCVKPCRPLRRGSRKNDLLP
ncbi:Uncharacterized protein conserved in bacteria [Salmonella enterica subsp. enterica]|uniref:Uncharacterized protein conserved in bacteria n=1 Tax=Salmonella enterica I TaxID=59201 RepID=A0A379V1E7_SALET|nr:Uncharacterized protein conserved in bacteria [Salmonella enterica subsp. enterica]